MLIRFSGVSVLLLLLCCSICSAQRTDYTRIIMPLDSPAADFREFLVQLAWLNSPDGAVAREEVLIAQHKAKTVRKEWMRDLQATFNLNEGNLRGGGSTIVRDSNGNIITETTSGNVFFPRYNFGVNLNLYSALTQKDKNQISQREILVAEHKVDQRKLAIRAETLTRYEQYLLYKQVLQVRRQVEQDTRSTYVLVEQQYRTDEKTFEDFTTASSNYFQSQEARMRAEIDLTQALYRVEEVIGLRWDQVVHPQKN
jgi:outer membrane protein TolC